MVSLIRKQAPDFKVKAVMPDNSFQDLSISDYKGKYVVLFFYPLDFTFVCPTEIIAFNEKLSEFKEKGAEVIAVSVDSEFSHLAWKNTAVDKGGIGNIQYPLVSDLGGKISRNYGVFDEEENIASRGLFLLDKEGIIRHLLINDDSLGRNVDEALRLVDALKFTEENNGQVCPANWQKGKESMEASAEGTARYLAKNAVKS